MYKLNRKDESYLDMFSPGIGQLKCVLGSLMLARGCVAVVARRALAVPFKQSYSVA